MQHLYEYMYMWLVNARVCHLAAGAVGRVLVPRTWCKLRNETSAGLTAQPLISGSGRFESHWDQYTNRSACNWRPTGFQWWPWYD